MKIEIRNLRKNFGKAVAVDGVSLSFPSGDLVALLGPSGSGKTTLLRLIAGIELPDQGRVLFDGADVTDMPVRERGVGFVFQSYALFEHMSVAENVAFGLKVRGAPRAEITARVKDLLARMQLEAMGHRMPTQLSGGQRQRVALARALAPQPKVLLLDEPFGALDARVRQELRRWLRKLHDDLHVTSILVTHDHEEAFEVAHRVAIMNAGRVEQAGDPESVIDRPANAFVMDFIGDVNVLPGRRRGDRAEVGGLSLPYGGDAPEGSAVSAYVRNQDVLIARSEGESPHVRGEIVHAHRVGLMVRVTVRREGDRELLTAELPHDDWLALGLGRGDAVVASIKRARIFADGVGVTGEA